MENTYQVNADATDCITDHVVNIEMSVSTMKIAESKDAALMCKRRQRLESNVFAKPDGSDLVARKVSSIQFGNYICVGNN